MINPNVKQLMLKTADDYYEECSSDIRRYIDERAPDEEAACLLAKHVAVKLDPKKDKGPRYYFMPDGTLTERVVECVGVTAVEVWVALNSHGHLAKSSESSGIFQNRDEADEHVQYLREQCGVYDIGVMPMVWTPEGYMVACTMEKYKEK